MDIHKNLCTYIHIPIHIPIHVSLRMYMGMKMFVYVYTHAYHIYTHTYTYVLHERICTNKLQNMHVPPTQNSCRINRKIHDETQSLGGGQNGGGVGEERGGGWRGVGNLHLPRHSNTPDVRIRHK